MKITIPHRWSSAPVAIEDVPDDSPNPLRTAVEQLVARGASLDGARLVGARLDGASLVGASLRSARLDGARLDGIRADFRAVLDTSPAEVGGLLAALREGRINGSQYQGTCACLVGTIANVRGCYYESLGTPRPNSSRPAEIWFLALRPGHTPANNQVASITESWILEWQAGRELIGGAL